MRPLATSSLLALIGLATRAVRSASTPTRDGLPPSQLSSRASRKGASAAAPLSPPAVAPRRSSRARRRPDWLAPASTVQSDPSSSNSRASVQGESSAQGMGRAKHTRPQAADRPRASTRTPRPGPVYTRKGELVVERDRRQTAESTRRLRKKKKLIGVRANDLLPPLLHRNSLEVVAEGIEAKRVRYEPRQTKPVRLLSPSEKARMRAEDRRRTQRKLGRLGLSGRDPMPEKAKQMTYTELVARDRKGKIEDIKEEAKRTIEETRRAQAAKNAGYRSRTAEKKKLIGIGWNRSLPEQWRGVSVEKVKEILERERQQAGEEQGEGGAGAHDQPNARPVRAARARAERAIADSAKQGARDKVERYLFDGDHRTTEAPPSKRKRRYYRAVHSESESE